MYYFNVALVIPAVSVVIAIVIVNVIAIAIAIAIVNAIVIFYIISILPLIFGWASLPFLCCLSMILFNQSASTAQSRRRAGTDILF